MNSVQEAFKAKGITAHTISSETHDRAVTTSIIEYLKNSEDTGHLLIITKEAYKHIPYFNRRNNWKIVIDEIPQVDVGHKLNLPRNMGKISSRVERGCVVNEHVVQIVAKDPKALRNELEAVKDDLDNVLRKFFEHIISDNYETFVERSRPIRWCNSAGQVRRNVVRTVSQRLGPPVLMHHHG